MARTNKWTTREAQADPKYFSKNGNFGESPKNIKKDGSGKSNWGTAGDEINDLINSGEISPIFNKQRRGSNTQMNERRLSDVQNNHE
ncbi:ATPase-stabilizing factor 15 kDa protein [Monosporozyma unispora]|nr:ATPase stabilizing factor 15 kDa protein [Kazachstania unispora]